jgi:hypothetical protein
MKIRVITPTLGESPWLHETVRSVSELGLSNGHVLVAPGLKLTRLKMQFPAISIVPERGGGMYAAINDGAATGDWDACTYINDDDMLMPRFAAAVRVAASADKGSWLVYGGVRLIDVHGKRIGSIPISRQPALNRALYAERLEPVYQHGTIISRAAWTQLGGFNESLRFCGDSELLARACAAGIPFLRVRGEVAAFRLRAGQLTKNRAAMEEERAHVDMALKLRVGSRTWRRRWARVLFRATNTFVYAERIARHGFVSFDEVLARSG